jgi:aconitate hydratase
MTNAHPNSFGARDTLRVGDRTYTYFRLDALERAGFAVESLPYSLKILLENLVRFEDGRSVKKSDIERLAGWRADAPESSESARFAAGFHRCSVRGRFSGHA